MFDETFESSEELRVRLTAEIDLLKLILANERGQGAPPSPGWTWNEGGLYWCRIQHRSVYVKRMDFGSVDWIAQHWVSEDWGGGFRTIAGGQTAREAMEAADLILDGPS